MKPTTVGAVALGGPLLFTLDWVLLGWSHGGYLPLRDTVSSLSAQGIPGWLWMVAGQLALALALAALALLSVQTWGRNGWVATGFLVLAACGTVLASAFRTICTDADASWCTPLPHSAFPRSQWIHGVGTGIAIGGVLFACLVTAVVAHRTCAGWRDVALVSLAAEAVALPHLLWFLTNAQTGRHGWAEKVLLVTIAGWISWCGYRLPRGPGIAAASRDAPS